MAGTTLSNRPPNPAFKLHHCGSLSRAGRTPPPQEERTAPFATSLYPNNVYPHPKRTEACGCTQRASRVAGRPWAGVRPADPLSRKSNAQSTAKSSVQFCRVRAARSPGGPKAQRAGPAVLRTAIARPTARPNPPPVYHHILSGSACRPLPRAAKPLGDKDGATRWVARARQTVRPDSLGFVLGTPPRAGAFGNSDWAASTPIRGRRFLSESRYSLSVLAIRRQR